MIKENFIKLYENSFRENWDLPYELGIPASPFDLVKQILLD